MSWKRHRIRNIFANEHRRRVMCDRLNGSLSLLLCCLLEHTQYKIEKWLMSAVIIGLSKLHDTMGVVHRAFPFHVLEQWAASKRTPSVIDSDYYINCYYIPFRVFLRQRQIGLLDDTCNDVNNLPNYAVVPAGSGVTRVGVTRGGNWIWWVSPYFFLKIWRTS